MHRLLLLSPGGLNRAHPIPADRAALQQHMAGVFSNMVSVMLPFGLQNQEDAFLFKASNMETGEVEQPPADHWHKLVAALQLSDSELRNLAACHEVFAGRAAALTQRRGRLVAQLQAASTFRSTQAPLAGPGLYQTAQLLAQARGRQQQQQQQQQAAEAAEPAAEPTELPDISALLEGLDRCLKAEYSLDVLMGLCCMQLLPWVKVCRAGVHSWPYVANIRMLLHAAHERQQAQLAQAAQDTQQRLE